MDQRTKRIVTIAGIIFVIGFIALLVFYFLVPKLPSTQDKDKTVIIDNYSSYTAKISSDSFGYLGNYLYKFIKDPKQGVYHATIVDKSYEYSSTSWFSKFTVKLKDSDISWNISMQTINDGEINGDIGITCNSGGDACLSLTDTMNTPTVLQDLLPITTDNYVINYQKNDYDTLSVIYYNQDGTGKNEALEKIKSLGFKPEDYTIKYYYGGR